MDETIREKLLSRFVAYLDSLDHDESGAAPAAEEEESEADLFSVFVELAGLRNEVRTQSRIVKEALDRFRSVFDTLQASHAMLEQELKRARADAHDRERTLLKPLLLDIIDVRDRLAAGLKPVVAAPTARGLRFTAGSPAALRGASLTAPPPIHRKSATRVTLRGLRQCGAASLPPIGS